MTAPWFSVATYFKGLAEVHGSTDNPKIVEMFKISGHPEVDDDETPWCAAFVGACLRLAGYKSSGSLGARSYQRFGQDLGSRPQRGCIAVFTRGDPNAATGHVAFFDHEDGDHVYVLGGNQSDKVCLSRYAKGRLLGYRWPVDTAPLPDTFLPTILQIDPDDAPPHVSVGATVPVPAPPLQPGAVSDPGIRAVQTALAALNYSVGPIDGEFGPLTSAAIQAFQRDRGLAVTGTPDLATRHALGLDLGTGQPAGAGAAAGMTSDALLRMIIATLAGNAAGAGAKPGQGAANTQQILQTVIAALLGRAPPTPAGAVTGGDTSATPSAAPVLSPIDKMLGGEMLAGKKTLLAVLAYVVLAILQATDVVGTATGVPAPPPGTVVAPGTVVGTMTATGQILTTLIAAFGGLGVVSKVDRVVQLLGLISAKTPTLLGR